ncbi:3-ketoacyl-ACP reductase [Marinobacter guineae]|uniref:3-ketoacyl-ACP reductase n=2 Tax=Marinobacter guineae TaxID=432303 RepID=A0A2G1VG11_9GAMM|nr:3-ketoacyl-ACP reductase [Marinobacter guineae]
MEMGLKGKNAVVTGGSKGIGRSIALALAAEGVNVAICARSEGPLDDTLTEIEALGVKGYREVCDVGDKHRLDAFLDNVKGTLGSVDILVCNVSALGAGNNLKAWDANITLDLLSTVRAVDKVLPWMKEAGSGNIIILSSISGIEVGTSQPYAATKAALISYAKSLAVDHGPDGIRVNSIAPGSIKFPGGVWDKAEKAGSDRYHNTLKRIPWGRFGRPEEVANVAVFLASNAASWVTGACIPVDGAQHRSNM